MVRSSLSHGNFQNEEFLTGRPNPTARSIPHCRPRPAEEPFPVVDSKYAYVPPAAGCPKRPLRRVGLPADFSSHRVEKVCLCSL